jgi:hypothetical protein
VNPDLDAALPAACTILGVDPQVLTAKETTGFEVRASRRISGVAAKAEQLDGDLLSAVMR